MPVELARPNFALVRQADWRSLLRLSGEAHEIADALERRQHVSVAISRLTGACATNLFEIRFKPSDEGFAAISDYELTGTLAGKESLLRPYITEGLAATDPAVASFVASKKVVGQSAEFASRYDWEASAQYQRIRRPAGIDHQVYANLHVGRRLFGFGLHRATGEKAFDARELQCVEALMRLSPHAFGLADSPVGAAYRGSPAASEATLPQRLRPVLSALLSGDGSKQIAMNLGLSRHTVLEYTKQIYRRLGVHGRGELMALFVERRRS